MVNTELAEFFSLVSKEKSENKARLKEQIENPKSELSNLFKELENAHKEIQKVSVEPVEEISEELVEEKILTEDDQNKLEVFSNLVDSFNTPVEPKPIVETEEPVDETEKITAFEELFKKFSEPAPEPEPIVEITPVSEVEEEKISETYVKAVNDPVELSTDKTVERTGDIIQDIVNSLDDMGEKTEVKEEIDQIAVLRSEFNKFKNVIQRHISNQDYSGAGSGEVRLEFLDDVQSSTAKVDGKFLKYSSSDSKWIGATAAASGGTAADDVSAGDAAVNITTTSGNITIDAAANNTDIIFKGTDATADITMLTLDGSEAGAATFNDKIVATELDISGNVDVDGTLEADAYTVDGTTLAEYIADTTGAMVSSNTETGITVTYQDGDNTIDFALASAQTTITSLLATDIKIGEDDQTKVDFGTANEIHLYADNANQIKITDGAIVPASDNDIDLGTSSVEFKDAYFDGTVTADAFAGPLTGDVTGNVSGTAATVTTAAQSNITSLGTLTTLTIDNVIINGTTIGHTNDTDLITVADGVLTVAGELDATTLDISGNADIDGTLEADAYTVDGTALNEYIADTIGAMVGSNTETGITVSYQDGDNTLDFVIGTLNQDTTGTSDNFTVSANNSTNETVYPIFVDGATGSQGAETDTGLSYNPSSGNLTIGGELVAATLDISGNVDVDGTLEADAITVDGTTLAEYIADTTGAMVGSNTETGISVTYQDGDNTIDFAVDAAQTTITSLLATDIKIGEDDQTKVDFETANEIHFYADNAHQVKIVDGAIVPASDNDIDLGTSSVEFKDAYFDGTVTADAFAGPINGNLTGTLQTAAQGNVTSLGTLTALTIDNVVINGATIGHGDDTDLMTVADGVLTVAGELDAATLDISGNADIDGTLEADAYTVDGTTLAEYIADTAGAMVSSNTETGIAVTYQDGDNTIDFAVDAAQTAITSIYNSSLAIGYGSSHANINFGTDNQITLDIDGTGQIVLKDGIFHPVTDSDVDLGKSDKYWKDAYIDTITTTGLITSGSNLVIADAGNIGSASDTDAIAIASNGVVTFSQNPVFPDGGVAIADLDIDGGTDIGAALVDADEIIVDDGGGGTNRRCDMSRVATYVGAAAGAFSIDNLDIDGGTDIGAALVDADEIVVDDGGGGTNRRCDMSRVATYVLATPTTTGNTTFGGAAIPATNTDTSNSGSITLDFDTYQNHILTFTGNVTLANPSTENVGQSGVIVCIQDGTGSRTLSLGTDYETAGGAGITLSTAANAVDVIPYFTKASGSIQLGAVQKAFS